MWEFLEYFILFINRECRYNLLCLAYRRMRDRANDYLRCIDIYMQLFMREKLISRYFITCQDDLVRWYGLGRDLNVMLLLREELEEGFWREVRGV